MSADGLARARLPLSRTRHDEGHLRTFALAADGVQLVPPQPPGWSYLVYPRSGALTVRTAAALIVVSPQLAVWIPGGEEFSVQMHGLCDVRIAYVKDAIALRGSVACVRLTDVLCAIVERSVQRGFLDPQSTSDARLVTVFDDELATLGSVAHPAHFAWPRDPMLANACDALLAASPTTISVSTLAARAHVSRRTFERRFIAETGSSPTAWIRRLRLARAAVALADGAPLTNVAMASGYESLSAFITAYRRLFGTTPGRTSRRRSSLPEA